LATVIGFKVRIGSPIGAIGDRNRFQSEKRVANRSPCRPRNGIEFQIVTLAIPL
jgi:hypothetical protein